MMSNDPSYISHFIQVNGIKLHYFRSTPAVKGPTLLLVHGISDNGMCWIQMAEALRARYNLVVPDLRGHGLSDKPEKGYHIETMAADIAGLIDALCLDRPAIMGQSLGGVVALATVSLFPDKARCVILEEPALFTQDETPEERPARTARILEEGAFYESLDRDQLIAYIHQEHPTWHEVILGPTAESKLQMSINAFLKILDENQAGSWRQYLPKISCPILLLGSDPAHGAMITPELLQEVQALWQDGRVIQFKGAGHTLHQELFEPCLQAVEGFLDDIYQKTAG